MKKTLLALAMLLTMGYAQAQLSFGEAAKFNDGWSFQLSDAQKFKDPEFNDKKWRAVTLPHDWSIENHMSPTLASCQGYLPGGIAWYRKSFSVEDASKHYYIYFEGVYNRSEVYLNGQLLGARPNGYVSFAYDMTPYLNMEGENTLAVRVDHSREADSRWYTGSGIYRDVWIVESGDVHLAQWGVAYRAAELKGNTMKVEVDFAVESHVAKSGKLEVVNELFNAEGKRVASDKCRLKSMGEGSVKQTVDFKVSKVNLWDLDNPYLYNLVTTLYRDGKKIDGCETNVGLRMLDFNADKGFALNGEWTKVKGVCLHHDAGVLGAVVPEDVWRRRLTNLKALGVNAIRMSHNPQAPVVYHLCDELGLLVMDEAFDEWEFPKRKWLQGWNAGTPGFEGTYDYFEEWSSRDVTDMVRRDRNHPCVFMWSIGNEVDYPNDPYSHPVLDGGADTGFTQAAYGGYQKDAPDAMRIGVIGERLANCVRAVDTSRPTTGALAGVVMSNQTAYPHVIDVVGYNYTESRYITDHEQYPNRIIYGSENRSDYKAWTYVRDMEHIFGQFIWTGTDYLGESGRWPARGLGTGLLDFASLTKPRGAFRASLWSETPTIYVGTYPMANNLRIDASDTWNYTDGQMIRVVCFTNAPQARLLLNGKVVGEMKPYNMESGIIHWDIPFAEGELVAEGCNADGVKESCYKIETCSRPYALRATVDKSSIGINGRVAHVIVEVLDDQNRRVKLADNMINCKVSGAGSLLGLENGSNKETSYSKAHSRRVSSGRLLAYIVSGAESGSVKVEFSSPLLKGCTLNIDVE